MKIKSTETMVEVAGKRQARQGPSLMAHQTGAARDTANKAETRQRQQQHMYMHREGEGGRGEAGRTSRLRSAAGELCY